MDGLIFCVITMVFMFGGFVAGVTSSSEEIKFMAAANKIIAKCEKQLPRDVKCKLVAVIDKKQEGDNEWYAMLFF